MALALLPLVDGDPLTLKRLLGWALAPFMWLLGVPWNEAVQAGGQPWQGSRLHPISSLDGPAPAAAGRDIQVGEDRPARHAARPLGCSQVLLLACIEEAEVGDTEGVEEDVGEDELEV